MEQHQPSSNSPYIEPTPIVSQPAAHHSTQVPDSRLQNDQRESNEQPSLICGFTSTELANVAIQVAGIIIAAIFGAWAVKSYESSNLANRLAQDSLSESNDANLLAQAAIQQSLYANVLALINFCLSEQFRDATYCRALLQATPLASILQSVVSTLPTISPSTSPKQPPGDVTIISPSSALTTTTLPSITPSLSTSPTSNLSPLPSGSTITHPSATRHIGFGSLVGIIIGAAIIVATFYLIVIRYRRAKRSRFLEVTD